QKYKKSSKLQSKLLKIITFLHSSMRITPPVLEKGLSQGLGAGNQWPVLKKGLSQGLEAGNQWPVLKKGLSQGLEAQNQCPVLEKGLSQGLESQNQCPVLKKGLWQGLGRTWPASMQAGHFLDHAHHRRP
ncbi:MAG: hypothetical protein IKY36_00420, partial [Bacteroidales bacterium]|nr:hypothetical protein [Bacteroidales bacterium]